MRKAQEKQLREYIRRYKGLGISGVYDEISDVLRCDDE
jgi:hypothetical protein